MNGKSFCERFGATIVDFGIQIRALCYLEQQGGRKSFCERFEVARLDLIDGGYFFNCITTEYLK